jgi:hypothetical protein
LLSGSTKSCGKCKKRRGDSKDFKGCGEIHGSLWSAIRRDSDRKYKKRNRSKRKDGMEFTITIEYAWELFLKQNRKCVLSGIELKFSELSSTHTSVRTASLDRIDSTKGYVPGNVQWVHKKINLMKQSLADEDFIYFCKKVAENNE